MGCLYALFPLPKISMAQLRTRSVNFGHKLIYLLQEAWCGVQKGGWMNWAAISTLTLMLFLLGTTYIAHLQLEAMLQQMGNVLEITAYLKPDADTQALQAQIVTWNGVQAVRIIPKEVAWQQLLTDLGQSAAEAEALLGDNPLLDALKVATATSDTLSLLAGNLKQLPGIESVWYVQDLIRQLDQTHRSLRQLGIASIAILTSITLAVISTTIRLVTVSRREEIEIMQLVGASPRWIILPFLLQGAGFGFLGALLAGGLLWLGGILLAQILPPLTTPIGVGPLPLLLVGFGVSIGVLGSWFSVRRLAS